MSHHLLPSYTRLSSISNRTILTPLSTDLHTILDEPHVHLLPHTLSLVRHSSITAYHAFTILRSGYASLIDSTALIYGGICNLHSHSVAVLFKGHATVGPHCTLIQLGGDSHAESHSFVLLISGHCQAHGHSTIAHLGGRLSSLSPHTTSLPLPRPRPPSLALANSPEPDGA